MHASMVSHNFDLPVWLPVKNALEVEPATICHAAEEFSACCLSQICNECGVTPLLDELASWAQDNPSDLLKWKAWVKSGEQVKGKMVTRIKLEEKTSSRIEAVHVLKGQLATFATHCFYAKWQQNQHSECIESFGDSEIVTIIDFSEKIVCRQQSEVQTACYSRNLVTLFPAICDYKKYGVRVRDAVSFVSSDLKHDAAAVNVFMSQLFHHLKMQTPTFNKLIVWSDGCASQFKSRQPFFNLSNLFGHEVEIEWHYFGSQHGKVKVMEKVE